MTTPPAILPPHRLLISCASTQLRVLRESDIPALLDLKARGIASPEVPLPFLTPWHLRPDHEAVTYWYTQMAESCRPTCTLTFAVIDDGEIVGLQDIIGAHALRTRSAETGSWLAREFHGRGIGTRMRQMILAFAFDILGLDEMRSAAHVENLASRRVSEKCGYVADGTERIAGDDGYVTDVRFVVTPDTFIRPTDPVTYEGLAEFTNYVGLS
ncbi:GNAT family N-acetyltransferase [Nanchangia anserum]|uniref:GNAT family N-acetyltransferase n=1 Tax=Nanchangia anserum TaxID=2692125 RepID=A0A8I0GB50_9ACTO|nr:GNAT family N-acetyltransferase [Nanchangia anserum]MBD3689041.1 GNAT family N-acetyltransferase [Nanchangia anserum]QOX81285.1 GNAT family N-acetyltransferase [Nanchangia anserum]